MSNNEEQFNEADYVAPLGLARMALNWAGAIVSIALIAGLVYWVFNLGTRNPNDIPIIRAMEGPSRTQPENPGGEQANHQGLAVNAVQSEGSAEKPAETVVLAPKTQPLAPEDKAQGDLAATKPVLRPTPAPKPQEVAIHEAQPEPVPVVQDPSLVTESIVVDQQATVISSSPYAPLKSPVPKSRPGNLRKKAIEQTTEVAAAPAKTSADTVPVGTKLVQLGAYDSQEIADKEWTKLLAKHGDLLTGKDRLVQSAQSGGRKFYRLRAMGFQNAEDSRNLCSALLARGTPCIPVTAR